MEIELNPKVWESMKPAKVIKQSFKEIVGIDFSNDGQLVYTADSTTLNVYVTTNGQLYRKLYLKTLQIQQISHTHHNLTVLVATKKNNQILYWSIHENRVIKIFKGHRATICLINMCPKNDHFLTTSYDGTLRIWDLNSDSAKCKFVLNVQDESISAFPVASYDPCGVAFGVIWSEQQRQRQVTRICLYDKDDCEDQPFKDWRKDYSEVKQMKFSNDGELLILATAQNIIVVLNAFHGNEIKKITNFMNESSPLQIGFSPDSKYMIFGSQNGTINVWSSECKQVIQLKAHVQKVNCLKFSPNQCLLVSGGCNTIFWLPEK